MRLNPCINLIAAFAIFLAPAASTQQAQKQGIAIHRAVTPQYAGTFSPRLGWVPSSTIQDRMGTHLVVNNSVLSNYYSVQGKNQEWIDNNRLHDRNADHTEQVNGLVYTYCSADINPNGVGEVITIYDDSTYCGGPVNWPTSDCSYSVSGLPGAVNGVLACWTISLDLLSVECNLTSDPTGTREMGWGAIWDNSITGPWLAGGGYGSEAWTWFDWDVPEANAFMGCYWFGLPLLDGFAMKMYGGPPDTTRYWAEDLGGTSTSFDNASLDVNTPVKNGNTCTFTVTDPLAIGIDQMAVLYSRSTSNAPHSFRGGNVLVDPFNFHLGPIRGTSQTITIPVGGIDIYTQAACFSSGRLVGFSNGLRHQGL